ncbi:hypothetical protein HPP92_015342 [Vanilla planifolia]|uniref:Magnesium transporter n=1 Tax=Vanilla planifolia TaxID=51239 RepID=A0A835QLP6_VANPL|nr:hypothetical protein HPP92_015884 [Vanilla planifolia]KAG0475656.1 hypothetical protein HPP92_015342 [Vanilla planifolia]
MARDDGAVAELAMDLMAVSVMKKVQASRSWILFDPSGESRILDVDKHWIMHRFRIHARDIRIIDPLLSYPSTILVREKAIVLNLEHIKAIITADEVMLRDPLDDNVVPVVEELRRRLPVKSNSDHAQVEGRENRSGSHDAEPVEEDVSPFEFRSLEVALEAICSYLDARTTELENAAYPALDELTSQISSRNLDRVRRLKSSMTRLTARVQKVKDELEQLLEDDEDIADLYLSRKLDASSPCSSVIGSKISRAGKASAATFHGSGDDVEELEMILEAYYMQIDGTLNKLNSLREYIDDTEDYINIQLDNHRNQLIQLELFLSAGTCSLTLYSLAAGIFGMNIPYSWNDHHGYVFKWVVIVSGVLSVALFATVMAYARFRGLIGT